jgi:hypothetical protein
MAKVEVSPVQITESSVDDLRELCRDLQGTLYAILDSCDEPRVPQKVKELGPDRAVSLYRGWAERQYWALAPYLVQVDEQLLDWIVENLWDDPWGIFAIAATDLAEMRKHFRRFLIVKTPNGEQVYFRFYDPRVLRSFLSTCSHDDYISFFGPIGSLLVKSESPEGIAVYRQRKTGDIIKEN